MTRRLATVTAALMAVVVEALEMALGVGLVAVLAVRPEIHHPLRLGTPAVVLAERAKEQVQPEGRAGLHRDCPPWTAAVLAFRP